MQSIFGDLSSRLGGIPEVEVLLATFNGEPYVRDFLESLTQQEGVRVHLRVSDDGSKDKTIEIVKAYMNRFESCIIFQGPCNGPSSNFFSLISKATLNFIALADQDDIWLPEHLINSVRRLEAEQNLLSLTFCQVMESKDFSKGTENIWPNLYYAPLLHEIFFQNLARGCTMVLRKELAQLITSKDRDCAIMHDWWIYLVAKTCGTVIFSINPEVKYRLHANNTIGHGPKLFSRFLNILSILVRGQWAPWAQLEQIKESFQDSILPDANEDLDWILNIRNQKFRVKFSQMFFSGRRFRKSFVSNLLLKCFLLRY